MGSAMGMEGLPATKQQSPWDGVAGPPTKGQHWFRHQCLWCQPPKPPLCSHLLQAMLLNFGSHSIAFLPHTCLVLVALVLAVATAQ